MTWRELIFMIEDITKQISDDSNFNENHIIFLSSKYRNAVLNQQYLSGKKTVNQSNYQSICLTLEPVVTDICPGQAVLRSIEEVPFMMTIGRQQVYPVGMFTERNKFNYVPIHRLPYVGGQFSKSSIYSSIGPDRHLYLKSEKKSFMQMRKITFMGLFEDIDKTSILEEKCKTGCTECDVLDTRFPLEDALTPVCMQMVIQDLIKGIYQLRDDTNDAADTSDQLAQAIQRYTTQSFKNLVNGNKNEKSSASTT